MHRLRYLRFHNSETRASFDRRTLPLDFYDILVFSDGSYRTQPEKSAGAGIWIYDNRYRRDFEAAVAVYPALSSYISELGGLTLALERLLEHIRTYGGFSAGIFSDSKSVIIHLQSVIQLNRPMDRDVLDILRLMA